MVNEYRHQRTSLLQKEELIDNRKRHWLLEIPVRHLARLKTLVRAVVTAEVEEALRVDAAEQHVVLVLPRS